MPGNCFDVAAVPLLMGWEFRALLACCAELAVYLVLA